MDPGRKQIAVSLKEIDKTYRENGIHACRSVSLNAAAGETVALIGENGSGKSTLMKLMCGYLKPDSGTILIGGEAKHFSTTADALETGIGMVRQQVRLIPDFSVLDNLLLGNEPTRFPGRIERRRAAAEIQKVSDRYGIPIELSRKAGGLDAVERQNVSLLYLLSRSVKVIVLDEPTTIFDDRETEYLYRLLARLKEEGHTIFIVTHKLREALGNADTIAVLREGRLIRTLRSKECSLEKLTHLMIDGKPQKERTDITSISRKPKTTDKKVAGPSSPLLSVERLTCNCEGYPPLKGLSFSLSPGEAIAVLGMREAGLETVERLLAGLSPPDTGEICLFGERLERLSPELLRKKRVAYVPTDRMVRGASISSTVAENLILLNYRTFHGWATMKEDEIQRFTKHLFEEYGIRGGAGDRMDALSGGNIQKVIIGRELSRSPSLILFAEPSWGLDVASRKRILEKIDSMKQAGSGVLLLTSDIDEALSAADRIVVLHGGAMVATVQARELDREKAGRLMLQGNPL
ncbi:ABC transporter ATP-binding protein [Sediminispirochaeta bajacaliforniensis]|uniref:ABC transporter ATP-binding protein n=1 Tax=Sediminispirochaeta bajacaliforniensis TaxID=148 RepID=UPI0003769BAD|nr:ATP-binding cassette domain-containing protein [Sediminispirochaeta bajacaliforniensis]